jgi:serine/threonine protein kinase
MVNSNELDQIGAAIAALQTGEISLAELEARIANGLSAGSFSAGELSALLRKAVEAGTASSEVVRRVLGEDVFAAEFAKDQRSKSDGTRLRPSTAGNTLGTGSRQIHLDGQLLSDRYRLERALGEGGMGVVYFARDEEVKGEIFAIKVLKPEIRERPEALELVREEVRKTRSLAHPNIVGVYSVNLDRNSAFILMEYLDGKALDALIDEDFGRGMPFDRAWPLIQDICAGLAYAHDHSVIHSDLKPSNIFVSTAGKAKLLDFGIARAARGGSGRFDPATLGALTPAYASCEMLEGGKPDQRDDVYALGCVIYEMLSGKHPFDCPSALEARRDGMKVAPIASLTAKQNAAVARTLAFDRAKRTDTVEALLSGLAPTTAAQGSSAFWARPMVWIGLACLLVLLLSGIVWFALSRDSTRGPQAAGQEQQAADGALSRVQSLIEKARALELDPADQLFAQGTQQLTAARQNLAAGAAAEGTRQLMAAQTALEGAISSAKRLARLGSPADEIASALALCQRSGNRCTASDFSDEPPRTVALSPFELDRTEVSNAEFAEFAGANHYVTEPERAAGLHAAKDAVVAFRPGQSWKTLRDSVASSAAASSGYPVRGIDYKSAADYCGWRGRRLPTEDEWEYVARGTDHRIFGWGNEPRNIQAESRSTLLPVNDQPATGLFGTRGLGDGLLEWVNGGTSTEHILRGASWLDTNPVNQRLAMRRVVDAPIYAFLDSGFRCAQSLRSWPEQSQ